MFLALSSEVFDRFAAAESLFSATHALGGQTAQMIRGLVFVPIYATYEFAVCGAVRLSIDQLNAHKHQLKRVRYSLLPLFLDGELTGLRSCGTGKVWGKRISIFREVFSAKTAQVPNDKMPHDGSNFEATQIEMILDIFGIRKTPPKWLNLKTRIDEVVERRNAVAHGRETPEDIGKRYTPDDVLEVFEQMRDFCRWLLRAMENHCADRKKHRRRHR